MCGMVKVKSHATKMPSPYFDFEYELWGAHKIIGASQGVTLAF
jgi:hypothetical protein